MSGLSFGEGVKIVNAEALQMRKMAQELEPGNVLVEAVGAQGNLRIVGKDVASQLTLSKCPNRIVGNQLFSR